MRTLMHMAYESGNGSNGGLVSYDVSDAINNEKIETVELVVNGVSVYYLSACVNKHMTECNIKLTSSDVVQGKQGVDNG